MQTLLPYRRFEASARCLDKTSLGQQRVETMQIMHALVRLQVVNDIRGGSIPWGNDPAVKMWRGFEYALMSYQTALCNEWTRRGYNDTCLKKTQVLFDRLPQDNRMPKVPRWLGLKRFHSLHRANLLLRNPKHYVKFGWKEKPTEGFWFPKHG